jgi:hypothetical protein
MPGNTRKLQYKQIKDTAATHIGTNGDIWYDPNTTTLRFYNGEAGGELLNAGGTSTYLDYGSLPTNQNRAIDLTYKNHWIVNLNSDSYHYTLANGTEGQELVFFAAGGLRSQDGSSNFWVDNLKYWDDGMQQWNASERIITPFRQTDTNNIEGMIRAVFLNGCWNIQGTYIIDQGGFP